MLRERVFLTDSLNSYLAVRETSYKHIQIKGKDQVEIAEGLPHVHPASSPPGPEFPSSQDVEITAAVPVTVPGAARCDPILPNADQRAKENPLGKSRDYRGGSFPR